MNNSNSTMKKAPDFIPDMEQPKGFKVTKVNDAEYMGERYGWSSNARGWFKLSEHPEQAIKEETKKEVSVDNSKEGLDVIGEFEKWLATENIDRINQETTSTIFTRFVKKFVTDNYSAISLIINKFEKNTTVRIN